MMDSILQNFVTSLLIVIICANECFTLPIGQFTIEEYVNLNDIGSGQYKYSFKTSNDIFQDQEGTISSDDILTVRGSYYFITPDGDLHFVEYTADERGYLAKTQTIKSENVQTFLVSGQITGGPHEEVPPSLGAFGISTPKGISSALLGSLQG